MEGQALKLPSFKLPKLDLPRPTRWDWIAIATLAFAALLTAANLYVGLTKPAGQPFPAALAPVFLFGQLLIACGGLMVLGKTAKEGTWWGNLAAVAASLLGITGVLLAAALWAAA